MSYRKPGTGNTMNDYFSSLRAFNLTAPNLLKAATARDFEIWLDKLLAIDRRSLVLYLKEHKKEIKPAYWERARARVHWLDDKEGGV